MTSSSAPSSGKPASLPESPSPIEASPWSGHWFPVAFLRDLDRDRPTGFTLLGEDIVLWWDRDAGSWRAFADVCPHRLVPLSEGRINGAGELECPYHGWTFNGEGRCTAIPQAPSSPPQARADGAEEVLQARLSSPRSRCRSYATAVGQGLLFVFAGSDDTSATVPLPLIPPLKEEPEGWLVQDTFRDLPYDALTLLENVLDVSHVPFTHHATVGRRENAGPVEVELSAFSAEGFQGVWREGPRRGRLGSQFTTFLAPGLMWHDTTAKGFARILTVVYATPIRRGECRLFARFPFRFESPWPARLLRLRPIWLQHLGNHVVLEDDQIFLHWQERVLERRGGSSAISHSCYMASGADRYIQALHRWVVSHGGEPFPQQRLAARRDDAPLLERWESHSRHCASCRGADQALSRMQPLLWGLAAAALLAAAWTGAGFQGLVFTLMALALAAAALQTGRWRSGLRVGQRLPPRNR